MPEHGEYGRILLEGKSPWELLRTIESAPETTHDQWQVQIQAAVQMRAAVLLKSSYLTPEQVRAAHLEPVEDVARAVFAALERYGPDARVCVLPEGPQTVPYLTGA